VALIGTLLGINRNNQGAQPNSIVNQGSRSQATGVTPSDLDEQNDFELEFDKARKDESLEATEDGAFPGLREKNTEQSVGNFTRLQKLREQSQSAIDPNKDGRIFSKLTGDDGRVLSRFNRPREGDSNQTIPNVGIDRGGFAGVVPDPVAQASNTEGFGNKGIPQFNEFDSIPELSLNAQPKSFRSQQLQQLMENT